MKMVDKYRVVRDLYSGYEVQVKRWYFPFMYFQCHSSVGCVNTFVTAEQAIEFANKKRAEKKVVCVIE